jgi:hypothetical protein
MIKKRLPRCAEIRVEVGKQSSGARHGPAALSSILPRAGSLSFVAAFA